MSGGGSDANGFAKFDIPIIDGLGPYGGKMHTLEEFIVISSLESRAKTLSIFLSKLK